MAYLAYLMPSCTVLAGIYLLQKFTVLWDIQQKGVTSSLYITVENTLPGLGLNLVTMDCERSVTPYTIQSLKY